MIYRTGRLHGITALNSVKVVPIKHNLNGKKRFVVEYERY